MTDYTKLTPAERRRFNAREKAEDLQDVLAEAARLDAYGRRVVTRWVVTRLDQHGVRTLVGACQGRNTYETRVQAEHQLAALLENNSRTRLASVYGRQALDTFEVRPCDCYAGHFDPTGIYFDEATPR